MIRIFNQNGYTVAVVISDISRPFIRPVVDVTCNV